MPEVRLIDANALLEDLKTTVKAATEWKEEAHGTFIECALCEAMFMEKEVKEGELEET